ncbi:MAG: RNA polymerase factor sigma-54 [Spirochaetes bacterium]|nr:RNA polymerase factor sigma-54 [Spirochaetota bacterium]
MAVSIKLGQKQTQKLALTQSQRQSLELLQLSNLELSERITKELEENPVLEEDNVTIMPSVSATEGELITDVTRKLSGDDGERAGYEDDRPGYTDTPESGYSSSRDDDRKRDMIENAVACEESLKEHLLWQARLSVKDERELALYEGIITSLDDNGFLSAGHAELAKQAGVTEDKVREILAVIRGFDPVGCGVATAQESLAAQAALFHPEDPLLLKILTDHFEDLEHIRYEKIAKALGIAVQDVIQKSTVIQNLDPFPGRQFSSKSIRYITPDLEVKYLDGEILVGLNDDWIPAIRINSYYTNLLKQKSIEKKLKEYIQDKVHSARYLVKNIESRRDTILKVVRAIMDRQLDFLVKGPGHLKPLVQTDIAREVGLHESTVSRVTSNKFVQTSWGVFELKYFFVSRLKSGDENERSSDEAMNLIKDIIAGENPERPFSDDEIQAKLMKSGFEIARRTIAKYRGLLRIPPSGKRKKLNIIQKKR